MTEFKNTNQFESFGHLDIGVWNLFGIWNLIIWRMIYGTDGSPF